MIRKRHLALGNKGLAVNSIQMLLLQLAPNAGFSKMAKTEHSHPLGMVVSTHFRCGKGDKRGLKNGALPFNID